MEGQQGSDPSAVETPSDLSVVLDEVIADAQSRPIPAITPRLVRAPSLPGKADAIIGMRRSGKTSFLYQTLAAHVARGLPRSRALYLNFEDERLLPLNGQHLHLVTDALYRAHPELRSEEHWLLFDEIQNVPGWERFVRRMLDSQGVRVMLTGSSAKLLSKEIATSLRGRCLSTELLPFSFGEALTHAGLEVPKRWPVPAKTRSLLENRFDRYLVTGGFPEVQQVDDAVRPRILQEYVDVVLFRDVVERHGVSATVALRQLLRRLLRSPASGISVNKLYKDFQSQGIQVSKDSLHAFVGYFEDAYLLFTVNIHARSEHKRAVNPRKCYLVDHGLARASAFVRAEDLGHHLENIVFVELRRRGATVAYHRTSSGKEVDFLVLRGDEPTQLVQVCASLSDPATRSRELLAIEEAAQETGLKQAVLVTLREQGAVQLKGVDVRIEPAWRWVLQGASTGV